MDDGFRGLSLLDTMTRQQRPFRPLDWGNASVADEDRRVRMYVCGPTVYDFAHIGNARPLIVFDVLFRLLRHLYGEDRVTYVRNITDVDDKINARAVRDYPDLALNEAIARVTGATAEQFERDADALGCLRPSFEPRATAFVSPRGDGKPDMVSMIGELLRSGHAYAAGGEILFDVTSMPDYGALSHRRLDEQQAGARVAVDAHKRNPADFVLWKLSDEREPGWESPWGRGRPGWHIECSVMSEAYLGPVFDIHGGGLDLIFPHHENEIAQSRCAHGTDAMAQVWMHNGFVQVEGRKMAKSEGNFVTIHDLLRTESFGGRRWPGEVLRLAMLMTHYREPIDFSAKRLEEADETLTNWARVAVDAAPSRASDGFVAAWSDDLNGAAAIAELHRLRKADPASLRASLDLVGLDTSAYRFHRAGGPQLDEVLIDRGTSRSTVEQRIAERQQRIEARDFAAADRIRAELAALDIQLKDEKDPATGRRKTTPLWKGRPFD